MTIEEKFSKLGVDNAPGQEERRKSEQLELRGEKLDGTAVDFSHGNVDAFPPIPGSAEVFLNGYQIGGRQAYTPYRGGTETLAELAQKLTEYSGMAINPDKNLIVTPGTQGALFLAMGALINNGDKVAIVEPDYFANRKLVQFFGGELVPVEMHYFAQNDKAGLDLQQLEEAFRKGVKLFLFSNPNNPTGVIYSHEEIKGIAALAEKYGAFVIADELYSRQIFDHRQYTHYGSVGNPENLITIIGPSKTESMSGFRLGAAFGSAQIITRMEKLQAIVSLRAAGYCQSLMKLWFCEPEGWMQERIAAHQKIRDEILEALREAEGVKVRATEAGSYLFPKLPPLDVNIQDFVKILRVQAGVTVTPGTEFGPQFTDSFRINFSQDSEAAVAAIKRLLVIMERYRKR